MNLYQHSQLATLESHIDKETGEIDMDAFNNAQLALQDKQQAIVAFLKNETITIDMIDVAIKDLTARKKSLTNRHESLKDYLLTNMQAHEITEISTPTFSAKIKLNPPKLVIDDEDGLSSEYKEEVVSIKINNKAIKDDLKWGEAVKGAHLEQSSRLEIK